MDIIATDNKIAQSLNDQIDVYYTRFGQRPTNNVTAYSGYGGK